MQQHGQHNVAPHPGHWFSGGMRALAAAMLDPLYRQRHDLRILATGGENESSIAWLRRYGDVTVLAPASAPTTSPHLCGALRALPLADEQFDLVIAFDVLNGEPSDAKTDTGMDDGVDDGVDDGDIAALREFRRVLRRGGRLLLRVPAANFLRDRHALPHATHEMLRQMLRKVGFLVERCSFVNMLLFPLMLEPRLRRLHPPQPLHSLLRLPMALEAWWLSYAPLPAGLCLQCLAHCGKFEQVSGDEVRRAAG